MLDGQVQNRPKGKHLTDEVLSSYLDGALSAREQATVQRHLASCPACARNLQTLQQTVSLLKELPRIAAPRAFTLTEAMVSPQRRRPSNLFVFLRTATAAVAVLLAVVVAGDLMLRQAIPTPFNLPEWGVVREAEAPPFARSVEKAADAEASLLSAPAPEPTALAQMAEQEALAATESEPAVESTMMVEQTSPAPAEAESPAAPAAPTVQGEPFGLGGGPEGQPGMGGGGEGGGPGFGGMGGAGGPAGGAESIGAAPATEQPEPDSEIAAEGEVEVEKETETPRAAAMVAPEPTPESSPAAMMKAASPTDLAAAPAGSGVEPTPTAAPLPPATIVAEAAPAPTVRSVAPPPERAGVESAKPLSAPDQTLVSLFRLVEIALLLIVLALATATIASRARR